MEMHANLAPNFPPHRSRPHPFCIPSPCPHSCCNPNPRSHLRPHPRARTHAHLPAVYPCLQKIDFCARSTTQSASSPDRSQDSWHVLRQDSCLNIAPPDQQVRPLGISHLSKDVREDEDADTHAEQSGDAFSENDLGLGGGGGVVCVDLRLYV